MDTSDPNRIREVLDRLNRVLASEDWSDNLNPAQRAALAYLGRANRFSRSPSHVADYLCTTRGTASQTLKALEKKGLIERVASDHDLRSVSYAVTHAGNSAITPSGEFQSALKRIESRKEIDFEDGVSAVLEALLKDRGFKSFGICKSCKYHEKRGDNRFCRLLELSLFADDVDKICHEFSSL